MQISLYIPEKIQQKLKAEAEKRKISVSKVVSLILERSKTLNSTNTVKE